MIELGLGCIEIGRKWGVVDSPLPSEEDAIRLLDYAYELGFRYFDTAPAYGYSEQRIGTWLRRLTKEQQDSVTIATKLGEFWDFTKREAYRNYSYQSLKDSIDNSLELLGEITLLQVHGFTSEVFEKHMDNIFNAFAYAKDIGVNKFGISLSDTTVANSIITLPSIEIIQFPHNILWPYDKDIIRNALSQGKTLVVNRPYAMGKVAQTHDETAKLEAFKFILKDISHGVILTGTKQITHLEENKKLFQAALKEISHS